jgi:TRAP-type mannitol/chloroaromatic compound transport system permease large subunit
MLILGLCAFVLDAFEMIFVVIPIVIPPLLIRVPDATWVAVLTLLILQTSFLVPPFGYAVLMLRNRFGQQLQSGRFTRSLLPFLSAQLVVLAIVLAWPAILWRDQATLAQGASGTKSVSDEEQMELLRKQTDRPDAPQAGKDK